MTPEQMRDSSLLELFSLEAEAQTQVLSAGLLALERDPTLADQLESCMRAAHSLKGAARIVGVDAGVSALQDTLSRVVPGSQIHAEAVNDSVILTGVAASPAPMTPAQLTQTSGRTS